MKITQTKYMNLIKVINLLIQTGYFLFVAI